MLQKTRIRKTMVLVLAFLLMSSLMAVDNTNAIEEQRMELLKILQSEEVVEQFLSEMNEERTVNKNVQTLNRNLATEMLIITDATLVNSFEHFVKIKNKEGIVTAVVSTQITGSTASEIRSYLRQQKIANTNLQYVLLGGDETIIPPKNFEWMKSGEIRIATSDFYYSNVLSTWPIDEDIMAIVLEPDLYVGRIPVTENSEVNGYISKYIAYRNKKVKHTNNMAFIASNINKFPNSQASNNLIDAIIEHIGPNVEVDALYSEDLVDTVNGCAQPVIDKLQARDYSFLYGTWHGGDCYVIHDSEYDDNWDWWKRSFGNHKQYLSINTTRVSDGTCWYGDPTGVDSVKYYYNNTYNNFLQLEDAVPDNISSTYVAWIGSCYTTDLNYVSYTIPVQRDSLGVIVENYNEGGPIHDYWIPSNEIPENIYNTENCASEVFFNELGGPVALIASSCDDYPMFTYRVIKEFMNKLFLDDEHKIGILSKDSWETVSQFYAYSTIREMYLGYTLFGDPSMEVWSADAKKLVLRRDNSLGSSNNVFEAMGASGKPIDALICITDDSGKLRGRGNSPYSYRGRINDEWIITANRANYTQDSQTYEYLNKNTELPYEIDFEKTVDKNWLMKSNNEYGRVLITSNHDARTGNNSLIMDSTTQEEYATNEARLHLNLSEAENVYLRFYWQEFYDELHNEDGIFLSDDNGENFVKVFSLINYIPGWQTETLDLDSLVTFHGLEYNDNFIIKFQQQDDGPINNDGITFDDIKVYSSRSSTEDISLSSNYHLANTPNPFTGETTISFSLNTENTESAEVEIYNVKGQLVKQLAITNYELGNDQEIIWNANNFASGVYFYKLVVDGNPVDTKKMILLK
ncbi:MAG: T9SS type A sorting domain-containing protein [Candidatus Cloacimonetes bacterium]|nr:T9SS type A sorting domain-containing protein [Candidatus Cloacimonadota bacterium]MBT6994724.1 T9SS type A sorting domain-containing protein [Candidatus Cloacimonadota bacterium]MBT7469186.1 T9SS type A sorting domain-containing protein [Candidatus Cloacimonadota bacterium]